MIKELTHLVSIGIEAGETGANTGVFEGTVSYVLGNTVKGETAMADFTVVEGSDIVILIDDDKNRYQCTTCKLR